MKHFCLLILLACSTGPAAAQQPACQSVRTGTFDILPLGTGSRITRTADQQTEAAEDPAKPIVFAVKWLDDCTYELLPQASYFARYPTMPRTARLTVHITSVSSTGYHMGVSANFSQRVMQAEVVRVP